MPSSEYALPEASCNITLKCISGEEVTLAKLQTTMNGVEVLQQVLGYVWSQLPAKQQVSANLLPYYHTQNELHMEQGCLIWDCQFMPPATMHSQILGLAHMGHPGITHM